MKTTEGVLEKIDVIDPPEAAFRFFKGESRQLEYKIRNLTPHPIADFIVEAWSAKKVGVDKEGKPIMRKTKTNYAKVMEFPGNIPAMKTKSVMIRLEVPSDYKEKVLYKGKMEEQPYRVLVLIKAIRHIKEL